MKNFTFWKWKNSTLYNRLVKPIKDLSAMFAVKSGRPLVTHLIRMGPLVGVPISLGYVKVIITFLARCSRLLYFGGTPFLVIYLKAAHVCLQQAIGNHYLKDMTPLGVRLSRTKGGKLPRVIPILHRERIRAKDPRIIRLWTTLFSLYRVLEFKNRDLQRGMVNTSSITDELSKKASKVMMDSFPTFVKESFLPALKVVAGDATMVESLDDSAKLVETKEVISVTRRMVTADEDWYRRAVPIYTDPSNWKDGVVDLENYKTKFLLPFPEPGRQHLADFPEYRIIRSPKVSQIQLLAKPFLISKSTPTVKVESESRETVGSPLSTSPIGILTAVFAWRSTPERWELLQSWCRKTGNIWLLNRLELWGSSKDILDRIRTSTIHRSKRDLGQLGLKEEAAGKVRVFAMVDPFTQWLMKPLYEHLQNLLRKLPQDGEKDQVKPIERLLTLYPKGPFFSLDLKAATDRMPVSIQVELLTPFLGRETANLWKEMLVARDYNLRGFRIKYSVGQPMGALSSWHMLAFTHHALVQWASLRSGFTRKGDWFDAYAVLGDDIVIANERVANAYLRVLDDIGMEVGLAKSLLSRTGTALEFAKRTFLSTPSGFFNVSAVPFTEYWTGIQNLGAGAELIRKYSLTLTSYLTFRGFGYKVKGAMNKVLWKQNRRVRHAILTYLNPSALGEQGSFTHFLSLKTIVSTYKSTPAKLKRLIERFAFEETALLEARLLSERFVELMSVVTDYSTVRRDREWYGTKKDRGPDRLIQIGQDPFTYWQMGYSDQIIFDSLIETVYREAFLDVRVQVRELKQAIEDMRAKEFDISAFEDLWVQVRNLEDTLGALPLPKNIYERVEEDARTQAVSAVKRWEKYSIAFRTTISELSQ